MNYPFSAIVGQQSMKLALILNAIDPGVGGVLIKGEKGAAKSTAVRSLARVLPEIEVIESCPYSLAKSACEIGDCPGCFLENKNPVRRRVQVVDLPLNATEDMVIGSMDFASTIQYGSRRFQPGVLAKANNGFLYVDEVNLLDDYIVDIILDSSASGANIVQREGMSLRHPARFILVGTMNPEEGDLRPQFLDRFGLCVVVSAEMDPEKRSLLMRRNELFELDRDGFSKRFQSEDSGLSLHIVKAREALSEVTIPDFLMRYIADLCLENHVAGHRADLVIKRSSIAYAALQGHGVVTIDDIKAVSEFALEHRRRDAVPPQIEPPTNQTDETAQPDHPDEDKADQKPAQSQANTPGEVSANHSHDNSEKNQAPVQGVQQNASEKIFDIGRTFKVKPITIRKDKLFRRGSGKRSRTRTHQKQGKYIKSSQNGDFQDLALDATLRAAAPHQISRGRAPSGQLQIRNSDIRNKIREKRIGNFLLFVVDASGSMGARGRMMASKAAMMSLLIDAYQKRDKVAMVSFRKKDAYVNLPPTSSIDLAAKLLREMPVGGRTPLSAGLAKAHGLLTSHLFKEPYSRPLAIIITDGKANSGSGTANPLKEAIKASRIMAEDPRIKFVVIDTEESGFLRFGLALKLASAMNADYFRIEDLKAETIINLVRQIRND